MDVVSVAQIVETMPQTEIVADFVTTLGAFYELVDVGPETGGTESGPVPAQAVDNHRMSRVFLRLRSLTPGGEFISLSELFLFCMCELGTERDTPLF